MLFSLFVNLSLEVSNRVNVRVFNFPPDANDIFHYSLIILMLQFPDLVLIKRK